ncbi:MAG TPA: hypothetical protein V6C64_07110 [Microcoleaceae cyanobacterium]|jgi:hypothetical protein
MRLNRKRLTLWTISLLCLIGLTAQAIADKPSSKTIVTARSANQFVDSLCVTTHWSYTDTPYAQRYPDVKQKLVQSGIQHVRDGLYQDRAQDLGKQNIRMTIVADVPNYKDGNDRTIQDIVNQIKTSNAAGAKIDAVEGPNEADLFWDASRFNKKYKGQGFPQGLIAFQKDLYAAIKRDPATQSLKVIGPSLGVTYDPGAGKPNPLAPGSLAPVVDWGNFHPYPGGNPFNTPFDYNTIQKYYWNSNFPSIHIGEHPYLFDVYRTPFQPKPMAATETGYSTYKGGISEAVQVKYLPRLFLEFFSKGIPRTCAYEFVDEFVDRDRTNREANFGLLRQDLSPKPAYVAMKNLIQFLQDPGATFTPGQLAYEITPHPVKNYREPNSGVVTNYDRTQDVHSLLLQKRDRSFYLALWHEVSSYDTSRNPPRLIQPPAMPVTVKFNQPIRSATLYTLELDGTFKRSTIKLSNHQLELSVPDRVVIIKIG